MPRLTMAGAVDMDKRIIDIIQNFSQWRGDVYKLVSAAIEMQKTICAEELIAQQPEANTDGTIAE